MKYLVDIIILFPLTLSIYYAYKKGFFVALLGLFSSFVSFIASFFIYPEVYPLIKNSSLNNIIRKSVYDMINTKTFNDIGSNAANNTVDSLINQLNIPEFIKPLLKSSIESNFDDLINSELFINYTVNYITDITIRILSYIAVFIAISAILFIIKSIIIALKKMPVLKQFDKAAGTVLGILRGVLISFLIVVVLFYLRVNNINDSINQSIDNSYIMQQYSNGGIFEKFIDKFAKESEKGDLYAGKIQNS